MAKTLGVTQFLSMKKKTMSFDGAWKEAIGEPECCGSWYISGASASGKTRFCCLLAKYISGFERVLYNSLEEGDSVSLQKAFRAVGMEEANKRVILTVKEPLEEMIERLKAKRSPNVIFIDSLQYIALNRTRYLKMVEMFPRKLFIIISHAKGNNPPSDFALFVKYDAFVKIWVEGYVAKCESRYRDGNDEGKYIIWPEGAARYWGNAENNINE